jgi:hypothetical protein
VHPDLAAAGAQLGDALNRALGAEVRVTARGEGLRVSLALPSAEDALALADRLAALAAAEDGGPHPPLQSRGAGD